jgi:predicted outer membrane lipoprotein
MWVHAILVGMLAAAGWWMLEAMSDEQVTDRARGRTVAESMAVYRAAVVAFARTQPAFEGSVDDDMLLLPAWWHGAPGVRASVEGRMVAVYLDAPPQVDVLRQMVALAAGSILVGTARRATGTLQSPELGDTGIPVPTNVPDGAPVWLATRD